MIIVNYSNRKESSACQGIRVGQVSRVREKIAKGHKDTFSGDGYTH